MSSHALILDTIGADIIASQNDRDLITNLKARYHFLVGKKSLGWHSTMPQLIEPCFDEKNIHDFRQKKYAETHAIY